MDIGLSTFTYPWAVGVDGYPSQTPLGLPDLIVRCQEYGVQRLQVGDNLAIHRLQSQLWKKSIERATDLGIQIELGTRHLEKEHIRTYLHFARQARSPFLRVVIDGADFQPGADEVIGVIRELLPEFRESGILLGLENHDRFSAVSLKNIIESTDPEWVGICLDTSNSIGAGEGVEHVITVLAPYVINLHFKDITIKRVSHKMGFTVEGCKPGQGIISLSPLLDAVYPYQRCQSVTLEQWPPFTDTLAITIQLEKEWAEAGIELLKNILL